MNENNDYNYNEIKNNLDYTNNANEYSYNNSGETNNRKVDSTIHNYSVASLVLGIVSLVLSIICCCTYFSWIISIICGILGIIFGCLAKDQDGNREGIAKAGIICSIIGITLSIIMVILFTILAISNPTLFQVF